MNTIITTNTNMYYDYDSNTYYDLPITTWTSNYTASTISSTIETINKWKIIPLNSYDDPNQLEDKRNSMNNNPAPVRPQKFINHNISNAKRNDKHLIYLNTFKCKDKPIESYMIFRNTYNQTFFPLKGDEVISNMASQSSQSSSLFRYRKRRTEYCCLIHLKEYDLLNDYCNILFSYDLSHVINNYNRDLRYYKRSIEEHNYYLMYKVLLHPNDIFSVTYCRVDNVFSLYSKRVIINSDKLLFEDLIKNYI